MNTVIKKYNWLLAAVILVIGIVASSYLYFRIDLTKEKRFTISTATKKLLSTVDDAIKIDVFLTGDLPSDYKKLSLATRDFLEELKQSSNHNLVISFTKPGNNINNDTAKVLLYDSLAKLGVVFEQTEVVANNKESQTNQLIIPSALVTYKDRKPIAIDLRSSKKIFKQYNVVTENPVEDIEATRNAAEALLEFKFANAIDKLTRQKVPTIAYVVGNGEPIDKTVNDLGESLRNDYTLGVFNLKQAYPDANTIDALLIVKPTITFSDEDKLKLDQYILNGGKIIWCIDKLHAELDSLQRSQAAYIAYDRGLNIDDLLFKYGVRLNGDLVQDLNCAKLPIVIGKNADGSPRMQRIPWAYYPLLSGISSHIITKNLDRVLPIFPSSIDTVAALGITKTILLATDSNSRTIASPALVSANSVKDENDFKSFIKSNIPVAVLLEGRFSSLFANRLSIIVIDSILKTTGKPFLRTGIAAKQIVLSDADIVLNDVSSTTGPLQMGSLKFDSYRFANKEFLLNSIDFLVGNNGIFETRNKEYQLRLLDKTKVQEQQLQWQLINIVLPLILLVLFGYVYQLLRKKKYSV